MISSAATKNQVLILILLDNPAIQNLFSNYYFLLLMLIFLKFLYKKIFFNIWDKMFNKYVIIKCQIYR